MKKSERLFELAKELSRVIPDFLDTKGPGKGNHATNEFIKKLRARAAQEFGDDYSEKNICGDNLLAVDFYFPQEKTIVEVALGIKKPNSEFEKDILKALMARSIGNKIKKLIFFAKPGGVKKCNQPGRRAVKEWLKENGQIEAIIWDL